MKGPCVLKIIPAHFQCGHHPSKPILHRSTHTGLCHVVNNFPKVRLIVVGRVKKGWLREGLAVYLQRLPELEIIELMDADPHKEGEQILAMVKGGDRLIALTEEGQSLSSAQFATWISRANSHSLVFAIGSAEGLSPAVKQAAAQSVSLSPMTFPHEVARLLLVEQLYRAKTILQGSRYHK